jgi:hypothetical protein
MTLLPAHAVRVENGSAELEGGFGRFRSVAPPRNALREGDPCFLGIRPEDVRIVADGPSCESRENILRGRVDRSQFIGEGMVYTIRVGEFNLRIKVHHSVHLVDGEPIVLHVPSQYCSAVPVSGGHGDAYANEDAPDAPTLGWGAESRRRP